MSGKSKMTCPVCIDLWRATRPRSAPGWDYQLNRRQTSEYVELPAVGSPTGAAMKRIYTRPPRECIRE